MVLAYSGAQGRIVPPPPPALRPAKRSRPMNMEAHKAPSAEDSSLVRGPFPLPCKFGGV